MYRVWWTSSGKMQETVQVHDLLRGIRACCSCRASLAARTLLNYNLVEKLGSPDSLIKSDFWQKKPIYWNKVVGKQGLAEPWDPCDPMLRKELYAKGLSRSKIMELYFPEHQVQYSQGPTQFCPSERIKLLRNHSLNAMVIALWQSPQNVPDALSKRN